MADQDPGTGTPGTPPAPGAPPPPAPAAPPLPAAAAAPPPPRAPQRPSKPGKPAPFDQQPGFRKRVDQEAARVIQRKLGCTLEEAMARLAAAAPPPPAGAPAAGAAPAAPAANAQTAAELAEAQARIKKLKGKLARRKSQYEAQTTRLQLETAAVSVGIPKQYSNFALSEYENLFGIYAADPTKVPAEVKKAFDREPEMDDAAVFAYIRKTHMPTVTAPAPPPPVDLTLSTAPPASHQPGGEQPTAAPVGTPPTVFDAGKLSDAEWRKHKRSMGITG